MACYYPMKAYRSQTVNPSGKRSIVFNKNQGFADMEVELPCGQCIGCRLERSRQWAIRMAHEAQLHEDNCFLTLTYNDQNLPKYNSLKLEDFQKFMKRLRKAFGKKIRFFHCGEYGEKFQRPHYHAIIFGLDFKDKILFSEANDQKLYVSPTLNKIWGLGHATIGDVTFQSAAYVARYITKKVTGDKAQDHYNEINYETGEILSERRPEYTTMSRKPGIGKDWYKQFSTDVYPSDFIVLDGKKLKPPKYYDTQYEHEYPSDLAKIKHKRKLDGEKRKENNTYDRLMVREEIQLEKFKRLKRNYET